MQPQLSLGRSLQLSTFPMLTQSSLGAGATASWHGPHDFPSDEQVRAPYLQEPTGAPLGHTIFAPLGMALHWLSTSLGLQMHPSSGVPLQSLSRPSQSSGAMGFT